MKTSLFNNLVKPSVIVAMLSVTSGMAVSGMANADAKQDIVNARQETQIWTTYALSPYLRANDLKVSVQDGKATLSGKVDEDVNKELAKQIALGVKGIKEVDNNIVVDEDYNPAPTPGYGDAVDDVTITAAVKARLVWSRYSYSSAKVETKAGRVVLTGSVDSADAKELAYQLAVNTRGVVAVNNQLQVAGDKTAGESAKKAGHEVSQAVKDAWITAKVKSNFFYSANVDGSDIEVATEKGIVTLKGKVDSGAERALAIELAENVRGVKGLDAKGLIF